MTAHERRIAELLPDCEPQLTVGKLLRDLTASECAAPAVRAENRRAILSLSLSELGCQLAQGRAGAAELPQARPVETDAATASVLDGFRDGLILLFVDGRRCLDLAASLDVSPETRVMIARRTMLRG